MSAVDWTRVELCFARVVGGGSLTDEEMAITRLARATDPERYRRTFRATRVAELNRLREIVRGGKKLVD